MGLSDEDLALLRFEIAHPELGARKNEAIRSQLRLSPVRYYQKLVALTESPEALQAEPVLINRLRRMRDQRLTEHQERSAP